jgi:flavocytochrome c
MLVPVHFLYILSCALAITTTFAASASIITAAHSSTDSLRLDIIHGLSAETGGDVASLENALKNALARVHEVRASESQMHPVAVVGGGLSGLTASLRLLEAGLEVTIIDKRDFMGGNSAKASSGINGCKTGNQNELGIDDSSTRFYNDTMKCSGRNAGTLTERLVRRMTDDSKHAVEWIASRSGVDLPDVGQLGGHSAARTHRPRKRLAGAAFISGLERAVLKYKDSGRLNILKGHRLVKMNRATEDDNSTTASPAWDLHLQRQVDKQMVMSRAGSVILATGGFANDKVGAGSLLQEVAPHLMGLRSTNGEFATGDGIKLARDMGAGTVDLDMVQVHPTGFSDTPTGFKDTGNENSPLTLCAEILRGVGGVLLDASGSRFANELDTRKNVVALMNSTGQKQFVIALPPQAAPKVPAHINIYKGKGLLHAVDGVAGVAEFVRRRLGGQANMIEETFKTTTAQTHAISRTSPTILPGEGTYHVGVVQPVLHYTMGGLAVDEEGRVMDKQMRPIDGLYAAGEIMGGVHGENRLGGSSLLDCVVFGLASANSIIAHASPSSSILADDIGAGVGSSQEATEDVITYEDAPVAPDDQLRVKVEDKWYDLSRFVDLHPGGALIVENGEDLTKRFTESHGDDWELFTRDEVTEVTEDGRAVKHSTPGKAAAKKMHRTANYGGVGGSWREILGRRAWFFLHSVAAKYPDNPTENDKTSLRNLVAALGQHYPCKLCRKHLKQQLRDPDLGPVAVNSRQELTVWFCELHNMVNRDIGKKEFDCNPFNLDMMYLKDCGECEHTTKKDVPPEVALAEERTKPGYHPPSGPWDASLYQRDPLLLQSVKSVTDAFDAKEADDLLNVMRILGTIKTKEIETIREALRRSPDALGDWLDVLAKSGEVARQAIINDPSFASFALLSKTEQKPGAQDGDDGDIDDDDDDDDDDDEEDDDDDDE